MKKLHGPFIYSLMLSLLVSACGGGGGGSDGVESTNTAGTPVAEESLPDINYTAALLPLMVGSYTGTKCNKSSGMGNENTSEILYISAEGDVTLAETQFNIYKNKFSLFLIRNFDATGVVEANYSGTAGPTQFSVGSGANSSLDAIIGSPPVGVRCNGTSDTDALKTKSLYSAISKYVYLQESIVKCFVREEIVATPTIKIDKGEVVFNGESYSLLGGLKKEAITHHTNEDESQVINYHSAAMDGRTFYVQIDEKGKLSALAYVSGQSSYSCFPKA